METPFLSASELDAIQARDGACAAPKREEAPDVEARPPEDDEMTGHLLSAPELAPPSPFAPVPLSPQGSEASIMPAALTPEPRDRKPLMETPEENCWQSC